MNRFVAITGMALFLVCLIGWAALAWAQPSMGRLPSGNDLSVELSGAESGGDSTRPGAVPIRPQGAVNPVPGSLPMPMPPAAKNPAPMPLTPTPMPQPSGPVPLGQQLPPSRIDTPSMPAVPGIGTTPRTSSGSPSGTVLPPLGGAAEPSGLPGNPGASSGIPDEHVEGGANPDSLSNRQEPSVSLEWVGPSTAKVSQPNGYSLVVRNTCNIPVQQVMVRVRVPNGLSCGETEPKAITEGNVLMWELGALQAKQEKVLQMKLLAEQKGDVSPQAWVTFTGSALLHIKVREPKLTLKVQGPEKVLLGETAAFNLAVTNPGDGSADQVKIHAVLSEGLECPRGSKIDFDIGNLAAGETRNVTVMCMTKLGGAQKCEVAAEAEGGLRAKETTPVSVTMPRLELQVVGPGLRYLGRKALYTIKVSNPGDAAATNVTISDLVPDGFKVLAASDGGRHDFSAHTVSWFLGEIKPSESHEVKLEVQAVNPGEFKHKASAVGAHNLCAESELTTRIEGLSALMLEMVDTDDPIEVNGETAYEVRISNTGSKVETDIKLIANIPDKMEFKNATGPSRYREEGKTIVFEPLDKLAPKADAVYRLNVKALEQGTVRFKIQMTSTNLTEPVIKMEATRIYSDAPETKSSH
jgi:uncharacterized repeat protein (TIGR01451 family)